MKEPTKKQMEILRKDILSGCVMTVEVEHYKRLTDNLDKTYDANKLLEARIKELEAGQLSFAREMEKKLKAKIQRIAELENVIQITKNQLYELYDSCNETAEPEVYGTILGLHERLEQFLNE